MVVTHVLKGAEKPSVILDDEPDLLSEVGPAKDASLRVVPLVYIAGSS
jgi:hypothetical protein